MRSESKLQLRKASPAARSKRHSLCPGRTADRTIPRTPKRASSESPLRTGLGGRRIGAAGRAESPGFSQIGLTGTLKPSMIITTKSSLQAAPRELCQSKNMRPVDVTSAGRMTSMSLTLRDSPIACSFSIPSARHASPRPPFALRRPTRPSVRPPAMPAPRKFSSAGWQFGILIFGRLSTGVRPNLAPKPL